MFLPLAMLSQYVFGPALFLLSVFIVLIILLQRGRGGGLTGALGGAGGASAFGVKAGDIFTRITAISVLLWIVLCALTCFWYLPDKLNIASDPTSSSSATTSSGMGAAGEPGGLGGIEALPPTTETKAAGPASSNAGPGSTESALPPSNNLPPASSIPESTAPAPIPAAADLPPAPVVETPPKESSALPEQPTTTTTDPSTPSSASKP